MSRYATAHVNLNGPGDARPTAFQIVKDENAVGKLKGKVAIVTGGNSGIGIETAKALHLAGATVYVTTRDECKGKEAAKEISKSTPNGAPVEYIKMSLDSFESIRSAAKDFYSRSKQLNILVENAGVFACPEGRTADGFETQFGTDHLGHFLLFQLLRKALLDSTTTDFQSRVVTVSSVEHRLSEIRFDDYNWEQEKYDPMKAYGQAKLGNLYTATEIERRYGSRGVHGIAVHPGGIKGNAQRHLDQEWLTYYLTDPVLSKIWKSPQQGAATTVYAAVSKEWEGKGGKYLNNCVPASPQASKEMTDEGYAPFAYDEEKAARLWELSLKLVGEEGSD